MEEGGVLSLMSERGEVSQHDGGAEEAGGEEMEAQGEFGIFSSLDAKIAVSIRRVSCMCSCC